MEELPASKRAKKGTAPTTAGAAAGSGVGGLFMTAGGRGLGGVMTAAVGSSGPMLELMDMDLMLQPVEVPSLVSVPRKVGSGLRQRYSGWSLWPSATLTALWLTVSGQARQVFSELKSNLKLKWHGLQCQKATRFAMRLVLHWFCMPSGNCVRPGC